MGKPRDKETLDRQVAGIRDSAAQKNEKTLKDVHKTIDSMKRKKMIINFITVAKEAKCSRATLYNNDQLKERIKSLRVASKATPLEDTVVIKNKSQLQEEKIIALREKVKQLETDKAKLIVQLVQMEELKRENQRLKNQKDKYS